MDEGTAEDEAPFDQLLDTILSNALWDTALISVLTAVGEDLQAWRADDGRLLAERYDSVAWRISSVVERLAQRFLALARERQANEALPGPPGLDQFLNWVATSLHEAQRNVQTAWELGQAGDRWDEVGQALSWGLYFAATLTTLFGTYDKFLPSSSVGRAAGN